MFIRYKNIKGKKLIDVRTKIEFETMNMTPHNIPVINEKQHKRIKKFYPIAIFIIVSSIIKNKEEIKNELIEMSNNKREEIIIACSRGRLRSPITYIYARILGIRCKVLWGGLKKRYKKLEKS